MLEILRSRSSAGTLSVARGGTSDEAHLPLAIVPGWRREHRCATCRIAERHPELLAEVHRLHVVHGYGGESLAKLVQRRLEPLAERAPSASSIGRHLASHLDRAAYAPVQDHPEMEEAAPATGSRYRGAEYHELQKLHAQIARQLDRLDRAMNAAGEADTSRLAAVAGLGNVCRATLESIAKTRRSADHTVATAQVAILSTLNGTNALVADMLHELVELAEDLGAVEIEERIRKLAGPNGLIQHGRLDVARAALEEVLATFDVRRSSTSSLTEIASALHPEP